MEEQKNYFSVCFNIMKMRYVDFDRSIEKLNFLYPNDKVNVFINFEAVLKRLCNIRDVENRVLTESDFSTLIMADMLNLAAHYKRFFVGNHLHTRVFLYMTDWESDSFQEYQLNDDYRSYYLIKYNRNPKYEAMREDFIKEIFPQVKVLFDFIPDVYFISAKNIDGSVVPYVIGESDPTYKNFVISSDIVDTQYSLFPNYAEYCFKRNLPTKTNDLKGYLENDFKLRITENNVNSYLNLYSRKGMYQALLASIGEPYRNIDRVGDLTPLRCTKFLADALAKKTIEPSWEEPELVGQAFPEEYRDEVIRNMYLVGMEKMYNRLTEEDRFHVTSQMVDRFDNNSLLKLNTTKFYKYPLMLEELTCQA